MTPLDAARELAGHSLRTLTVTGPMVCIFCGHSACRPNCLRHDIPKIVAALEAAERLVKEDPTESDYSSNPGGCAFCEGKTIGGLLTMRLEHAEGCPWKALEHAVDAPDDALKGEPA